jgi:hypothetical protein
VCRTISAAALGADISQITLNTLTVVTASDGSTTASLKLEYWFQAATPLVGNALGPVLLQGSASTVIA